MSVRQTGGVQRARQLLIRDITTASKKIAPVTPRKVPIPSSTTGLVVTGSSNHKITYKKDAWLTSALAGSDWTLMELALHVEITRCQHQTTTMWICPVLRIELDGVEPAADQSVQVIHGYKEMVSACHAVKQRCRTLLIQLYHVCK